MKHRETYAKQRHQISALKTENASLKKRVEALDLKSAKDCNLILNQIKNYELLNTKAKQLKLLT